ncbi:cysteine synthase A [Kitasatospora nipponensis]|uniref:Cysteine synthase A n=1 Tax=Kitasatospora nipponensis TaxID=258049 RepID=A0ABP4H728_9ACTN
MNHQPRPEPGPALRHGVRYGILATVGHTPLVRLGNLAPGSDLELHAKLERFNPTGSVEDRTALDLLTAPIRSGEIAPGRPVVLAADSGNLAIALAQVGRYYDLDLHLLVAADSVTVWHLAMLHAFGAQVRTVPRSGPGPVPAEQLEALADALAATRPGAYRPTPGGVRRPQTDLLGEIRGELSTDADYLFCPTSSAAVLRHAVARIRAERLATRLVAVRDPLPENEADPTPCAERAEQAERAALGLGPADLLLTVREADALAGCRRLLSHEGLLAGRSSGAVVAALAALGGHLPDGARCVLLLPDGGDRYADTVFCDSWVAARTGALPDLFPFAPQEAL